MERIGAERLSTSFGVRNRRNLEARKRQRFAAATREALRRKKGSGQWRKNVSMGSGQSLEKVVGVTGSES